MAKKKKRTVKHSPLPMSYIHARSAFNDFVDALNLRGYCHNKYVLDQKIKTGNGSKKSISRAIVKVLKDESRIPVIRDSDWKNVFMKLQKLDAASITLESRTDMRDVLEKAVRKLCGKSLSAQSVHNVIIKAFKTHKLPVFGVKVLLSIHPYFCETLAELEEMSFVERSLPWKKLKVA